MTDTFRSHLEWSGAANGPTRDLDTFSRDLDISFEAERLAMSAAPSYRGNPLRVNPEQLLVASVSACQALTYLSLCARKQVAVAGYADDAYGTLEVVDGKMRMSRITLRPWIILESSANEIEARELVNRAHRHCFIANSVSARVEIFPSLQFTQAAAPVGVGAEVDESC
jgi:organic hydroperoxide reductase OsmC/OhrA